MTRDAGVVIAIGFGVGQSSIEAWLAAHPDIIDALAAANARVVLVDVDTFEPVADWNAHIASALDAAAAQLDASIERPLFVAGVGLGSLRDAGITLVPDWKPAIVPTPRRGLFVGYFAVGEGGAIYVAPDGELRVQPEQVVRRALAQLA